MLGLPRHGADVKSTHVAVVGELAMIDGIDARVGHTDKWDLAYRAENSAQTNSSMMAVPMQANGAITSWLFAFEVI
jgi:hypothetical protein